MNTIARNVSLSTKFNLLKKNPILLFIGSLFVFISLTFIITFTAAFAFTGDKTPEIDYDLINSKGNETIGKITNIETEYNTTINGVHPTLITYSYPSNGKEIESKYKVLEERKVEQLELGSEIPIKELDNSSIIVGLKPFSFPVWIFMIPLSIFLIAGLIVLSIPFIKIQKELKLYKYGKVSKAKISYMMPIPGLPVTNFGQGVTIYYEYETTDGKKILDNSFTSNFSILGVKKQDDYIPIFVFSDRKEQSCVVPQLESIKNNWNIDFN
jgi:hypothetical protein